MTSVPLTSVGSGARVIDLFPLPLPFFIALRCITFVLRHWYVFAAASLFFFVDFRLALLFLIAIPLIVYLYVCLVNPRPGQTSRAQYARGTLLAAYRLAQAARRWRRACDSADLNGGPRRTALIGLLPTTTGWRPPLMATPSGNALTFTLNMGQTGHTYAHLESQKELLSAFLGARRARTVKLSPALSRITFEWERNLNKSVVANPTNQINATQLPRIPLGGYGGGLDSEALLEMDTSLLVVGESGSGKSNLSWNVINELNSLVHECEPNDSNGAAHTTTAIDMNRGFDYRIYVIDPKKVELAELIDSPKLIAYSDSQRTADDIINKFHGDMMERFEMMKKNKLRKINLSRRFPLSVLFIDELLLTQQARKGIDSNLGEILSAGRAAGFIVIANSQLGQVDALSRLRDLFPQRVCMAVKSQDLTNAVLGPNAEQRGARCTEITEKGVGYIYTDFAGSFQRFKPPFFNDTDIHDIAIGKYVQPRRR